MRLEKFRVTNFRNINDSGWIDLAGTTALVGRNESGKTNLLHALRCLSGPESGEALSITRDFPADRMRSEYSGDLEVVQTRWQLSDEECNELANVLPQTSQVSVVEVVRGYTPERRVRFYGLEETEEPTQRAKELFAQLREVTQSGDESADPRWEQALEVVQSIVARQSHDAGSWASDLRRAVRDLEEAGRSRSEPLEPEVGTAIEALSELTAERADVSGFEEAGRQWVLSRLPSFLYFDEFPDINGHMNLADFDRRRREGVSEAGDRHFETLLRMADIDPDSLEELLSGDPETRRQIVGRAGAGLTRKLRELWTDRPLKVRFNLDGEHFNALVCDPTAMCDIEVNLNQRSRGFRWFFSFFIMLTASRRDAEGAEAILLLDEPGQHLHAAGQRDLLSHVSEHLGNQSIIATQSPFMVAPGEGEAAAVRAVRFDEEAGATVSDDACAEELVPPAWVQPSARRDETGAAQPPSRTGAQISVPGELVTALFGSGPVLVLENLSDFLYVSAISHHFANQNGGGLPKDLVLMPAGGASAVPYLMALFGQPSASPMVLLTGHPPAQTRAALSEAGVEVPQGLVFLGDGLQVPPPQTVAIEDLIDPGVYDRFVRTAYRELIEAKEFEPDMSIATVVERYEEAFARIGRTFSRLEPARLIVGGSGRNMSILLSRGAGERFERIFTEIRKQLAGLPNS